MKRAEAQATYVRLPLRFERHSQARFVSKGLNYRLTLTPGATQFDFPAHQQSVRMSFVNGHSPVISGEEPHAGKTHYLVGNDPSAWRTNVESFSRVRYRGIWPGIDAVFYGNQQELEYDLEVAPGADPAQVRVRFEGAHSLRVEADGALAIDTAAGPLRQRPPVLYQEWEGKRERVPGRFILHGRDEVAFHVERYDRSRKLTIDPVVEYATFVGGNTEDRALSLAVDRDGAVYLTGFSTSSNLGTTGSSSQFKAPGRDAFVLKLDPTGSRVEWATYFGGNGDDVAWSIAVDSLKQPIIVGTATNSPGLPRRLSSQTTDNWYTWPVDTTVDQAFVAKFAANGSSIIYSNYIGGDFFTEAWQVALDQQDAAYIVGATAASNFPVRGAVRTFVKDRYSGFIMKLDQWGNRAYAGYLDGELDDRAFAVGVDGQGRAYVAGVTNSALFPRRLNTQQRASFFGDLFVVRLSASGTPERFRFFTGPTTVSGPATSQTLDPWKVHVDAANRVHIAGRTNAVDLNPLVAAIQGTFNGGVQDGMYIRMNADLGVEQSTYIGGVGDDALLSVAVNPKNQIVIGGFSNSANLPIRAGAVQRRYAGGPWDGFVSVLSSNGQTILDSTFLGGSVDDELLDLALDPIGGIYVAGVTRSADFPVTAQAARRTLPSAIASFAAKILDDRDCRVTAAPGQISAPAGGLTGTVNVTLAGGTGCFWTAASSDTWIRLNRSSGNTGPLGYTIDPNNTGRLRTGVISVSGQQVRVTQFVSGCTFALAPAESVVSATGLTTTLSVTAPADTCEWTPQPDVPWIQVPAGSRRGSSTFSITVEPNTTAAPRRAQIGVGAQAFVINQEAAGCEATATLSNNSFSRGGGNGLLRVSTNAEDCNWSVTSSQAWLRLLDPRGTGNGTVRFVVQPHSGLDARIGDIRLGNKNISVVQTSCSSDSRTGEICGVSPGLALSPESHTKSLVRGLRPDRIEAQACEVTQVSPATLDFAPDGAAIEITVSFSGSGCYIGVSPGASWLSVDPPNFQGSGPSARFRVTADPNRFSKSEQGSVSVFALRQARAVGAARPVQAQLRGRACTVRPVQSLTDQQAAPDRLQATIDISVDPSDCAWRAVPTENWILLSQGDSGVGPGKLNFELRSNASRESRAGAIRVNDAAEVRVLQRGSELAACGVNFGRSAITLPDTPGTYSINIVPTNEACEWRVTADNFVTFPDGDTARGSGTIRYSLARNTGAQRTAVLTVRATAADGGSDRLTITQNAVAQSCTYALSASSAQAPNTAGTGSFTVTAATGCAWTAASSAAWLRVTSGQSGTGNGTVNYTYDANTDAAERVARITVASQTFTLTQARGGAAGPVINSFTATPTAVAPGGASTLSWNVSNATTVSIAPGIGTVTATGTRTVNPTATTTYTLTATGSGTPVTQSVTVTVSGGGANRPVINAGGVVTVAAGAQVLTPLALVSIYGQNFTNNVTQSWDGANLRTTLAGVSVTIDGRPAYPLFVNPTFMNVQVPDSTTRGSVSVTVTNANGTSTPVQVQMAALAPEFKGWSATHVEATRSGPNPPAAPNCPNRSCPVGPVNLVPFATPARPGETISLWALGFGPSNPPIAAGVIGGTPQRLVNPVTITVGGRQATVPFGAFLQGVGLYQIDIIVPDLPDGEYDLTASVGGVQTLKTMRLAIRR